METLTLAVAKIPRSMDRHSVVFLNLFGGQVSAATAPGGIFCPQIWRLGLQSHRQGLPARPLAPAPSLS